MIIVLSQALEMRHQDRVVTTALEWMGRPGNTALSLLALLGASPAVGGWLCDAYRRSLSANCQEFWFYSVPSWFIQLHFYSPLPT